MNEGEYRPQHREIDKQLARAKRLDYRKEWQTEPYDTSPERTPKEEALNEAASIIGSMQIRENRERERQALERLTPEERERHEIREIEEELAGVKRLPIVSYRINRLRLFRREYLDKLQQHDPELMDPVITGIEKRKERQAKAERAIEQRGLDPGVEEYGEYQPLWERF